MMKSKRIFEFFATLIILGAVFSQFAQVVYKVFAYQEETLFNETLRYWGYMTIWTNTLIGLIFLASYLKLNSKFFDFFRQYSLQSASVVYIFLVAVIYHLLLRITEFDSLLEQINDFIFHTLTPIIYTFYWVFFISKKKLNFISVTKWMLYPSIYAFFVLAKGALNNTYPYFFFDVNEYGYPQVFLYVLALALLYGFVSYLFMFLNNKLFVK